MHKVPLKTYPQRGWFCWYRPQVPKAGDHREQVQEKDVQVWLRSVSPTCRFPKLLYLNHLRNCIFSWGGVVLGMPELVEELERTLGQTKSSKQLFYCPVGGHEPLSYLPQNPPGWHCFCRDTVRDTGVKGLWSGLSFVIAVCKISFKMLCFEIEVHTCHLKMQL